MTAGLVVVGSSSEELASEGREGTRQFCTRGYERGEVELTLKSANVSSPLNDGDLHSEADSEEGDLVLSSPLDGDDHSLGSSHSKATGHQDSTERKESEG